MNNLFQLENFTRRKLPTKFYSGLSGLLQDLGIDGNDVVDDFIINYVNHANKKSQTKSSVYLSTGFSRHVVKKCLEKQLTKKTEKRNTHYLLLLGELKRLSKQYENGLIPTHGKFGSYTSAFNQTKPSDNIITAKSMLDNLIDLGIIEKEQNHVKFISTLPTKYMTDENLILNILSNLMFRLSKTIQHNLKITSLDEKLYQMTYYSNSIIPSKRKELTDGLRELARKHFYEYQALIDSYEDTELSNQGIEDLNNEIGISSFIFNNKNEE
jgi:hypothetical protein